MLGEHCNWMQNVRAAHGRATLRGRRADACYLAEVPVSERPPVIRRYLQKVPGVGLPARAAPGSSSRRHHWWRWALAGTAAVVVLAAAAVVLYIKLQPDPPQLALPTARTSAPAGPLGGRWAAGPGSVAGFRVQETALGFSNDVVGRTDAVTGILTISGGQVTQAWFRVGLTTVTVNGKTQRQFATSLGTRTHPSATFTLPHPVTLAPAFASGATIKITAAGRPTMHGVTHTVTVTISGRRDGPELPGPRCLSAR